VLSFDFADERELLQTKRESAGEVARRVKGSATPRKEKFVSGFASNYEELHFRRQLREQEQLAFKQLSWEWRQLNKSSKPSKQREVDYEQTDAIKGGFKCGCEGV